MSRAWHNGIALLLAALMLAGVFGVAAYNALEVGAARPANRSFDRARILEQIDQGKLSRQPARHVKPFED
ncbi:MAG: hypothetical protein C4523_02900 [Myxococcales bacterium]|nr:MAG: hypothetical protein C4523_02900 [Myxococcales bacterium]